MIMDIKDVMAIPNKEIIQEHFANISIEQFKRNLEDLGAKREIDPSDSEYKLVDMFIIKSNYSTSFNSKSSYYRVNKKSLVGL